MRSRECSDDATRDIATRLQLCKGKMKNYDSVSCNRRTNANARSSYNTIWCSASTISIFISNFLLLIFWIHNCSVLVQFNCGTWCSFRWLRNSHAVFFGRRKKCFTWRNVFWLGPNFAPVGKTVEMKIWIVCTFLTDIIGSSRLVTMRTALIRGIGKLGKQNMLQRPSPEISFCFISAN